MHAVLSNRKIRLSLEAVVFLATAALLVWMYDGIQPGAANRSASQGLGDQSQDTMSPHLSVYRSDATFSGFTIYPVDGAEKVQLLNMLGQVVHEWNVDVERARLLPNGNLLVVHGSKVGRNKNPWKALRSTIIEYSWSGEVVWKYEARDVVHHDLRRLPNGNTLFLRRTMMPAEARAKILDETRRSGKIRSDSLVEVNRNGDVVWEWHAHEHLDLNSCGRRGCDYLEGTVDATNKSKDWTHMNTASVIPENRWSQAGDDRFRPGNIIVVPRNWWTALLVDRVTGEVLWEYGGDYRGGLGGGHEVHMIEEGLPGAGNILLFDNGSAVHSGQSIILEINPVTKKPVWIYEAENFFSRSRGSVQRLPNGNTLISEDNTGRVFEVTPDKSIVWEFVGQKPINRARRYPPDFTPKFSKLTLR